MFTYLCNAAFRLQHVSDSWKFAGIVTLLKLRQLPSGRIGQYRFLPFRFKRLQKQLLKIITTTLIQRITGRIEKTLED